MLTHSGFSVRTSLLRASIVLSSFLWAHPVAAQDMRDVEARYSTFVDKARELYRFDEEKRGLIWAAYCGDLDPSVPGGKEIAGDVGYAFQRDGEGKLASIVQMLEKIRGDAERLERIDSTSTRARAVLEGLRRENAILQKVKEGVVLRGANHPFTQYAIEHGKQMHIKLCNDYAGEAPVCDKPFSSDRRRPDLVTVKNRKLMIYEFKPEGQKSKADSEAQYYVRVVQDYYQAFFPSGRNGATQGTPDFGGDAILKALKQADDAWSSDGKQLKATPEGATYNRCEQPR